jgi:hypothetical protein
MIRTLFAMIHDPADQQAWVKPAGDTGHWHRAFNPVSTKMDEPQPASRPVTAAERRRNSASEDGQMGGIILDIFFNVAFPGLGALVAPISMLDAVEVYDQTRSAFHRSARPATKNGYHPAAARATAPVTQANRFGNRRKAPAFIFG